MYRVLIVLTLIATSAHGWEANATAEHQYDWADISIGTVPSEED